MKFEKVYGRTDGDELSQLEAAEVLGVSERTFQRWRDRGRGLAGVDDLAPTPDTVDVLVDGGVSDAHRHNRDV